MVEDTPVLSAVEMYSTESSFSDIIYGEWGDKWQESPPARAIK